MTNILLLGDSLVADHSWQKRMGVHQTQNFGVPGAVTYDLLDMLPDVKKRTNQIDLIMVMIGTNDILSDNYSFIHTLKEIVIQLNKYYPLAEIVVSSILPMELPHLPYNTITSLNTHIEAMTMQTGACFLDIHSKFISSKAQLFEADGVHLTTDAYEVWTRSLLEHIAFLVENE